MGHSTSQVVVEQRLNSFVAGTDPHAREGSIRSFHTAYSALEVIGTTSASALAALAVMDTENRTAENDSIESIADTSSLRLIARRSDLWLDSTDHVITDDGELDFGIDTAEDSIESFETADSLNRSEISAWNEARREFESVGITIAAYEANREFILGWFRGALESGKIAMNVEASNPRDVPHSDEEFTITAIPEAERPPGLVSEVESLYDGLIESRLASHAVQSEGPQVDFEEKRRAVLKLIHDLITSKLSRYHIAFALQYSDGADKGKSGAPLEWMSLPIKRFSTLPDSISSSRLPIIKALKGRDYRRLLECMEDMQTFTEKLLNRIMLEVVESCDIPERGLFLEIVRKLLDKGASPNAVEASPRKWSVLMCAIENYQRMDLDVIRLLLERGADTNYDQALRPHRHLGLYRPPTWYLTTPFMASLIDGDLTLASLLVRYGADVNLDITVGCEAGQQKAIVFRNPIEAAIASFDPLKLHLLFNNGARTGWLRAAQEYNDILNGTPVLSRNGGRGTAPRIHQEQETADGYRELERLLMRDAMPYVLHGRFPDTYDSR